MKSAAVALALPLALVLVAAPGARAGSDMGSSPTGSMESSNVGTPVESSISISGSRDKAKPNAVRVKVSAPDLAFEVVVPWVRVGDATAFRALKVIEVSQGESFTWFYRTPERVQIYFAHGDEKSNTITIRAR